MKIASLLSIMIVAVCLVGCENAELITCQQEKTALQGQFDQAQATITERDKQIEALKTENTEIQQKAMESITTMMTKQAAADEKLKKQLAETKEELKKVKAEVAKKEQKIQGLVSKVAGLEKQISDHKCPVSEAAAEPTATE